MISQAFDLPRHNLDSLNKRMKATATASVMPGIGAQTIKAIHHPSGTDECWETPFPSNWYINPNAVGGFRFHDTATDLLYRPNDKITLHDIVNARKTLETASVNYANGTVKATGQVGGTHYGNPATDVYSFAMANNLDAMQFNVVKYVTRFRKKDGMKDLLKAKQTLERLIAHEEGKK